MKKCLKPTLSILLAAVLLLTVVPFSVSAAETGKLTFTVSNKNAVPGETVDVDIAMTNNPGIASIGLNVGYDSDVLTVEKITFNSAMGGTTQTSQLTKNPVKLIWISSTSNFNGDAAVATITFRVNANITDSIATNVELTYDPDDIYNIAEDPIDCEVINGVVNVVAVVPGDINGDTKVNNKDVTRLLQYLAQWDVFVNAPALDTNGDSKVNNKDVTRLMQYLAHWEVELYPIIGTQGLKAIAAKRATCEEDGHIAYWYDRQADKYYKDAAGLQEITLAQTVIPATGHSPVIDPAVPATHDHTGLTEGSHCSVCGKILVKQEEYGPLNQTQYSIEYFISGNDAYLASLAIQNLNPSFYTTEKGVEWLDDLVVSGYNFEGWYDGQGSAASRVTSIPKGTARNIKLYAKWTKEVYTITFDNSSMKLPSTTKQYSVDQKVTLDKPTVDGYVFLGWTTDRDELVSEIKPGTTGHFTLHSNWTSKRNIAKPVSSLEDPIIIEDTIEGRMLFTYEIGQVENVPLYTIKNLPSAGGVVSVYTDTTKKGISSTDASTVAKAIDHITTDSTSWTLSEDWNETTHVEDSILKEHGYDRKTGQSVGKTSSNTYTLTTNEYDNTVVKANDGTVATTTQYDTNEVDSRATWESKASLSVSDTESAKYTQSAEVNAEIGVGWGPVSAKVGASMGSSTELSSSTTAGASEEVTIAHENTSHSKTGTDTVTVADNTRTTTSDKGWNKSSNSSSSNSSSFTKYEEETLSERIAQEHKYGQSYARGGSNSSSAGSSTSSGESNQYSTTFTYFNSEETTESVSYTINGESDGSYRLVRAGIVHVFAVVIYDVATAQYSVATYSVLDDETYTYIDYSATSAAKFDDNENGVLPFEVPYFVNEYVNGRIVTTEGLAFDESKLSTDKYEGENTSVIIPEFISVDNKDGTHSAYAIRKLSDETFSGKSEIKSVLLSSYIRDIPNSAFAGCTSLQFVYGSEIQSIGDYAFDGCTSLGRFKVSSTIEAIGDKAFRGVDSIIVTASNKDVVFGAINSGAKRITINISSIADEMSNTILEIPDTVEYFELQGGRNTFNGLKIKSNAETTVLNGVTISSSTGIPLEISSESLTLNQVSVESPSFVMLLSGNAPTVSLYGTSKLISASNNAVVCRNTIFNKISSNVSSKLEITGDLLHYGTLENSSLISFPERGGIVSISAGDFEKYIKGVFTVTFDVNGGTLNGSNTKEIFADAVYGDLPEPTRQNYSFIGWFDGETQITANSKFTALEDITLRARWQSGWALASSVPAGAEIKNTKWSYTKREYTESGSSYLSSWIQYDKKRTSWGATQGPVYSDPQNGSRNVWSEQYVSGYNKKGVNIYYRYYPSANRLYSAKASGWLTSSDGNRYNYDSYEEFRSDQWNIEPYGGYYRVTGYNGGWVYVYYSRYIEEDDYNSPIYSTRWYYQDPVYTYYYYRDVDMEATTDPTGQENVSNIQKWVKYIEK